MFGSKLSGPLTGNPDHAREYTSKPYRQIIPEHYNNGGRWWSVKDNEEKPDLTMLREQNRYK